MQHNSVLEYVNFIILVICLSLGIQHTTKAQCLSKENVWNSLTAIEKNPAFSFSQKLQHFYTLKNTSDKCNLEPDSVYSKILLKIGVFEIRANRNYNKGFNYIEASLKINVSGKKGSSKYLAAVDYFNYAFYYDELGLYNKALNYYDSTIVITTTLPDTTILILYSKLYKANIFFRNGDYQKAVEESTSGIDYVLNKKDSFKLQDFLSQRAQSLYYLNNLAAATSDINTIIKITKEQNDLYELASALKIKAYISAKNQNLNTAESLFKEVISTRIKTKVYEQIANDYIDYGNFLWIAYKTIIKQRML
jgi:tetratricopeptide (TPR) repeat protein